MPTYATSRFMEETRSKRGTQVQELVWKEMVNRRLEPGTNSSVVRWVTVLTTGKKT